MPDKSFPRDSHLTAIALAYKNPDVSLIAESVLPRVKVAKKDFSYIEYPREEMYSLPNTQASERAPLNEANVKGAKVTATTELNGIQIPLTADDVSEAPEGVDPRERATERASNIITLGHEVAVANLVFSPANFENGQKVDQDGGDLKRIDEAGFDPFAFVLGLFDMCLMRPNKLVFGKAVWTKFRRLPAIVSAALGNSGVHGLASREKVAEIFEVNEVLVGESFVNIAKPGKAPQMEPVWGKAVLALFSDRTVDTSGGVTFGFTAERGTRRAGTVQVKAPEMGIDGGEKVFVGEDTKPLIVAPHAGALAYNVIA